MIIKIKIQTIMIIILKIGSCKNHAKKIFHNSKLGALHALQEVCQKNFP